LGVACVRTHKHNERKHKAKNGLSRSGTDTSFN